MYNNLTDAELAGCVRSGDEQALGCLCNRYIPLCRALAHKYAGPVMELEDLMQEGMLGLLQAARRFDPEKQVPFERYSKRCIVSKMFTAMDAMTAQKRRANIDSVPLEEQEASPRFHTPPPDELFIEHEDVRRKSEEITSLLSKSENEALRLYLRGYSYARMAAQLGISQKSVDNALQRVRRKLRTVLTP